MSSLGGKIDHGHGNTTRSSVVRIGFMVRTKALCEILILDKETAYTLLAPLAISMILAFKLSGEP